MAWGLGRMGMKLRVDWFNRYLELWQELMPTADAHSLSLMLFGLALLGCHPTEEWMKSYCDAVEARLSQFNGQDMTCMLWALVSLR